MAISDTICSTYIFVLQNYRLEISIFTRESPETRPNAAQHDALAEALAAHGARLLVLVDALPHARQCARPATQRASYRLSTSRQSVT